MARVVIDTETGQIMNELRDGDRIVHATSIEAFREFESAPKGETFTKLYHKVIPLIVDCGLSASELILFMHLAVNLRYLSNVAKYPNGRLITRDNLQNDLKISESTVKRSIYRLIKLGLIAEASTVEGKVFIVNPFVVTVGDKINKTVYDLFRKSKWARW
jgi:hypothetical protein